MASMREIKRRRESIASTEQITKAMKLVATVKLQKARSRAESGKPYMREMHAAIRFILAHSENHTHPFLKETEGGRKALVLISSNRGLAGGFNSNLIRLAENRFPKEETLLYTMGKKGHDALKNHGYEIAVDASEVVNAPLYQDAVKVTETLLEWYQEGRISEIYLEYTEFKNTVVHEPKIIRLLPVERDDEETVVTPMNFDPDDDEVISNLIPQYMSALVFGALLESVASENGARMTAMDAATDNAEEMIQELSVAYNRARQSAITQELTEIIAGSGTYV
ncbi:MAG: ATP synthase F1 subunit gamma [Lachnospiraceae bacterium]|nr:ATP synthase F1 subunit gamma [Lachnospiraceae bacterium]